MARKDKRVGSDYSRIKQRVRIGSNRAESQEWLEYSRESGIARLEQRIGSG